MIQYNISLKNIPAFRKYANMVARFNIAGFVKIKDTEINMYDILEIISQGSVDSMILTLTKYNPEQLPELEAYMKESHLLTKQITILNQ